MTDKKQLLLVEDDIFSAETLKYALEAKGYEVIMATNGRDALRIVRKQNPQLVILDIMMPKMDGYHFCRFVKFDTRFKHIPVIFVSSKIQEADKRLGFTCGGNEYITKPYDINNLVNLVDRYFMSIKESTTQPPNTGETCQGGTTQKPNQGEAYQSDTLQALKPDETHQDGTTLTTKPEENFQGGKVQTMISGETFVIRDNARITVLNIDREKVKLCFNDSDFVNLNVHECKSITEGISIKILKIDMGLVELEIIVSDKIEKSKKWFF